MSIHYIRILAIHLFLKHTDVELFKMSAGGVHAVSKIT